RLLLVRRFP
ncbi:tryptophan/tyrosine permease family protein, partial [Vibrio parahaemolyticus VPTS-2010_2]